MTPEQIRNRLEEMAKAHGPTVSNIAKVKSVNETKATCILEDEDGQEIQDVRLRPVLNGKKSFIQIPKVGTFVLAIRIEDDDDWMVIACDEFTKVKIQIGELKFELETEGVRITNKGENLKTVLNEFQDKFGELCEEVSKIVVSIGVTPNVPVIMQIKQEVEVTNKNKLNKILID